jgi:polar amino acid transport system substrate-binding protein
MFQGRNHVRQLSFAVGAVLIGTGLVACTAPADTPEKDASSAVVQTPAIEQEGILKVCVNLGSPPSSFATDAGDPQGTEIDLATAVADELSLEPKFVQLAFAGLIPALQAQQCDVIMTSLYIKPEREKVVDFVPYLRSGSTVTVAAGNPEKITGYDDSLCGTKVSATVGATGEVLAQEMSDKCVADGKAAIRISLGEGAADGLQQLMANQTDAMINTQEVGGYYAKLSDGAIEVVGDVVGAINIGAATNKGNDALHEAIDKAFASLYASGSYDEILEEWGVSSQSIRES